MTKKPEEDNNSVLFLEYYQRPFALLQMEHCKFAKSTFHPHPIRSRFWQFIQPGYYEHIEAQELIESYLSSLEDECKNVLNANSIAYWLHLYRRLFPGPIGPNSKPETIGLTRAVLEIAIQKYAKNVKCDKIGYSKKVKIQNILGGLLMSPEFTPEKEYILDAPSQLVLTDFSAKDISNIYHIERLAYEIWRAGATKRGIAKGAKLIVAEDIGFGEARNDELEELIRIYDMRDRPLHVSSTGVWYDHIAQNGVPEGIVFLPIYNLSSLKGDLLKNVFKIFNADIPESFRPNFIWIPFNLRAYRDSHLPFADAFYEKNEVKLDAVLLVIACLGLGVFDIWRNNSVQYIIRYWQRVYEVPMKRSIITEHIESYLSIAKEGIGISEGNIINEDIESAIDFWMLTESHQNDIDLVYSGPHYIFLPYEDRYFIDFAWILRRLYDLFYGVSLSDQNFKGKALEVALRKKSSVLPYGECKSYSGERRQIDYAYEIDECLVIAECKAVSKSIAFDRGNISAIQYRTDNVVNRALHEVDEKAIWLSKNPKGTNYDISRYKKILPVGISPFVEYIPSLERKYWIKEETPRMLTPHEFNQIIEYPEDLKNAWNIVSIIR